MTTVRRLIVACVTAALGISMLTACGGGSTPPSCAKHQDGLSLTQQNKCLDQVGSWCQKNYPNDLACNDRVFGYVPGKPGDSD